MFQSLEELEKLTITELQEFLVLLLLTELKKSKKVMLELIVDYLKSEKLEMITSPTSLNAKNLLPAVLS